MILKTGKDLPFPVSYHELNLHPRYTCLFTTMCIQFIVLIRCKTK